MDSVHHLQLNGECTFGGWQLRYHVEGRSVFDGAADTVVMFAVGGRIRLAVVDPAHNDLFPGRGRMSNRAWGVTYGILRSEDTIFDALCEANRVIYDPTLEYMEGPMLCVGAIDLDPGSPTLLASARAGDCEIWDEHGGELVPVHSGDYITVEARNRYTAARGNIAGNDPARWAVQTNTIRVEDHISTPLGLTDACRIEHRGAVKTATVVLSTDGIVVCADMWKNFGKSCVETATRAFVHPDRTVVQATWVG